MIDLRSYKSREEISCICIICKTEFFLIKHEIQRRLRQNRTVSLCSKGCRTIYRNPEVTKSCLSCSMEIITTESKNKRFCNQSCSARYNNGNRPVEHLIRLKNTWETKLKKPSRNQLLYNYEIREVSTVKECTSICIHCHTPTKNKKYCNVSCQVEYQTLERIQSGTATSATWKLFLIQTYGMACWRCKNKEWNGLPIPLELEHKDGNGFNNTKENLEILCPNCHAQTPTYKGKNKGKGRYSRMIRYHSGKSY